MSTKTAPSSHPSVKPPQDSEPYYTEIAIHAQRMADEREDVPSLPEVPPLPAPPRSVDPERQLVRVCIVLVCLFFVVITLVAIAWGR